MEKILFKFKVSNEIKKLAGLKGAGRSASYVREAVQRAKGEIVGPTGIKYPKDYAEWLIKHGYKPSTKSFDQVTVGDIALFTYIPNHFEGHIQIFCDDKYWRSDFIQPEFFPYNEISQFVIYE